MHVALLERDRAEVGEARQKLELGVVEGRAASGLRDDRERAAHLPSQRIGAAAPGCARRRRS